MDIVITGKSALMLQRIMREKWPKLKTRPVPTSRVKPTPLHGHMLQDLNIKLLQDLGLGTPDLPLELSVSDAAHRGHHPNYLCHVRKRALPGASFLELRATKRFVRDFPTLEECHVFIDSIPLVIATQAGVLHSLVSAGRMGRDDAIMNLAQLICEFCGTYGRDAFDPRMGEVQFELAPLATVEEIVEYLTLTSCCKGIDIARAAARLATNGLASPMELLVYAALVYPPRLGGLHLKGVLVNEPLDLSDEELRRLGVTRITPDFRVSGLKPVLEYNGEEHLEKYRVRKDKLRAQHYARLGFTHYPIMKEDVLTVDALECTLRNIVEILSEELGDTFRTVTLRKLKNSGHRDKRARMLKQYGPQVTRYVT